VGGAYPGSGLATGSLALATREIYGDEGVAAPDAWLSTREIGIPLLEREGKRLYNAFDLDEGRVAEAAAALERAGLTATRGPFVTVSTCSGTLARGMELAARFGAVCESMEGAAYAHVAAHYGVPFLEVRGISNLVEDRDLSRWTLLAAAAVAGRAVQALTTIATR
jgi:futalosine hydrolase